MTKSLKELAEKQIELSTRIQAIACCNTLGKTNDELVALKIDDIETKRQLFNIEAEICAYIEGTHPAQPA